MTIQRFDTGPRMSQVVIHGDTVFLAGVVASNAAGESVTKQTQDVLSIIDRAAARVGASTSRTTVGPRRSSSRAAIRSSRSFWRSSGATTRTNGSPAIATSTLRS